MGYREDEKVSNSTLRDPRLFLGQLILSYLVHISFVLNLLHIFGAEVKRFHINRNFLNRSGKLIVPLFIITRHRCFVIHSYINPFIAGISVRLSLWYFTLSVFL